MSEKILLVDDEQNVLDALKRQLYKKYKVTTANGGPEGLETIRTKGPFAVIVSDMRMPQMNGAQLLAHAQKEAPDTTRIILTGYADLDSAIQVINEGHIYSFLTKPCPADALVTTVERGIKQYKLITSERELLSKTLTGSVKVLIDILTMSNPVAFGRCSRVRQYVGQLCDAMQLDSKWECEIASLLSQLGYIGIPEDVLDKVSTNQWLNPQEVELLQSIPKIGHDLTVNIPRLRGAAEIVLYQSKTFDGTGYPNDAISGEDIPIGARVLKVAVDYEALVSSGAQPNLVLQALQSRPGEYDPKVLNALASVANVTSDHTAISMPLDQLQDGARLAADIHTKDGTLIFPAGTEVSMSLRMQLKGYNATGQIPADVLVIPSTTTATAAASGPALTASPADPKPLNLFA